MDEKQKARQDARIAKWDEEHGTSQRAVEYNQSLRAIGLTLVKHVSTSILPRHVTNEMSFEAMRISNVYADLIRKEEQ